MKQENVLTLGIGARLVQHLGGIDVVMKILEGSPEEMQLRIKYSGITYGQIEALINRLGGLDVVLHILAGKKKFTFEDVLQTLADQYGRIIPVAGLKAGVVDANRNYRFVVNPGECENSVARSQQFLPSLKFGTDVERKKAEDKLRAQIDRDPRMRNLLNGTCLSLQLPQMVVGDRGTLLEEVLFLGLGNAYAEAFPDRKLKNYMKGHLVGKVNTLPESRQDRLVAMMTEGPVNCLYFPKAFQGFGVEANREMMVHLPDGFILSSSVDTVIGLTAYTKTLAGDINTPGLDCGADERPSAVSQDFSPEDAYLIFGFRNLIPIAGCSGGLLYVG